MDFKIPGQPHSTVKQLQSASVRELIQKIENHPNRHALQRDLQQSQSFNPFSQESKQMIHEVGNIELCESLNTEPKTLCKVCLSDWDIGIVCCTCGHFLRKGTEENEKFMMDLLSIPDYFFKKGPHGHRYGKKPGDKEYHIAHQLKKKCKKKYFQGIHDQFVRDDKLSSSLGSSAGGLGTLSSKLQKKLIPIHFHPKTLSSKNTFVQNHFIQKRRQFHPRHFHPKTVSSNDIFIPNHFHPTLNPKNP